ncbi:hypothetical protein [Corynebacterium gottingense]|uniref:hypothetical protein n=1 Tax=Corynebacterium gottingense TaxID=2041036 RepID=UPI00142D27BC|nr:hypothetical protein [Corynebacterium gottingense]
MRFFLLVLAAVMSLVAVVASLFAWPSWVGAAAIVIAGGALACALYMKYQDMGAPDLSLDPEQRTTILRMIREGNEDGAVRQVQLWKRDATPADASRIVREVSVKSGS